VEHGDEEALMGTCLSTTDWHLKDGQEEAFADRWTAFLKWTRTQDGFESARLVADEADPHHYLSVGEWRDSTSRQAWSDEPRFLELCMPCIELCDDVQSSQYEVKVAF
jgi:quinol monooxygenase YgiN